MTERGGCKILPPDVGSELQGGEGIVRSAELGYEVSGRRGALSERGRERKGVVCVSHSTRV